jgi:hypothetical protein
LDSGFLSLYYFVNFWDSNDCFLHLSTLINVSDEVHEYHPIEVLVPLFRHLGATDTYLESSQRIRRSFYEEIKAKYQFIGCWENIR